MNHQFLTLFLVVNLILAVNSFFEREITDPIVAERIKQTVDRPECIISCQESNRQLRQLCRSDICETFGIDREVNCNKACRIADKIKRNQELEQVFSKPNCNKERDLCLARCKQRKEKQCEQECDTEQADCKTMNQHLDYLEQMYKQNQKKAAEKKEKSKIKEGEGRIEL